MESPSLQKWMMEEDEDTRRKKRLLP